MAAVPPEAASVRGDDLIVASGGIAAGDDAGQIPPERSVFLNPDVLSNRQRWQHLT